MDFVMNVFLAEYATANDPALAPEGAAMLAVLRGSFERCGHRVVLPGKGEFASEIAWNASGCDCGLIIAPDTLLSRYTRVLEQYTDNIGCGSTTAAVCANKVMTFRILERHGIPVPGEAPSGLRVVKPVTGCGAIGIRLTDEAPKEGEFAERFIEGENLSVSVVCNRIIGEACERFSGNPPVVLALNRQSITRDPDGTFHYHGGETPVDHPRSAEIQKTAVDAVTVLGCQGYCGVDVIVADKVYVVDVNPRITTSIVGIAACMQEEIADVLISAAHGKAPDPVHLSGRVQFSADGKVTPA